ncbi:AglZ/HisF2 family acetamidino modification protein [uncultured Roseivirga sp.]|tara:strand:- start:44428 stop:45195 length:768 start_codon:yes stop_codon:yes gene_type:complete
MLRTRIIPCLQLLDQNLVKTIQFKRPSYIGDFANTARIFNELEVDELCLLGIRNTRNKTTPDFKVLKQVANECFMPLSYGGGIQDFETAKRILAMGFEKVVLNSASFRNPQLITKISEYFGSQSLIVSIDVKKGLFGRERVYSCSGTRTERYSALEWAKSVEEKGAGEILLTSINQEGTWEGFDIGLVSRIANAVNIPVIAHGGAGSIKDISAAVKDAKASAVALGSMVVYQKKGMGVLVNFPDRTELKKYLSNE